MRASQVIFASSLLSICGILIIQNVLGSSEKLNYVQTQVSSIDNNSEKAHILRLTKQFSELEKKVLHLQQQLVDEIITTNMNPSLRLEIRSLKDEIVLIKGRVNQFSINDLDNTKNSIAQSSISKDSIILSSLNSE